LQSRIFKAKTTCYHKILSENLSDSGVTATGGRLTVSNNILYDVYEVETPSGEVYTSYGITTLVPGLPITRNLILLWSTIKDPFGWK